MKTFVLMAVLVLSGCFAGRAAVGPNLATGGGKGVTASGGIGMGWSPSRGQAIYAVPTFGVIADDHARALMVANLSYVDYGLPLPVRVGGRFGAILAREKYGEEGESLFGAAVAVLPWHARSGERQRSEKGWGDIGPDLDMFRGLGIEVAVDALPASGDQRGRVMATISLTGDVSFMAR